MPTESDYAKVKDILCELAELPFDEQVSLAREKLEHEPELLTRVERMLEGLSRSPEFLEGDLPGMIGLESVCSPGEAGEVAASGRHPGATIQHFELRERIGEGGMAVVFRARQTFPVNREVALKVISAYATTMQRERFERECTTLARFSHPNVATMFESGISPAGEPYAAMELVKGLPISQWCLRARSPIERRIRLIIDACRGIAHAHEKGVLHRDIKPSNLLVTEVDGRPIVKVIDFGIAAALNPGLDQLSKLTGEHLIGTPAYMSPESVMVPDRQALDARSDVYSLGVVLFELLCGKRPYDVGDLTLADWLRTLTEKEAPRMEALFNQLEETEQQRIARSARTSVSALRRYLHSDLDLIVRKALALEPDRRYASSRELADDLTRFLEKQPVIAHSASKAYRAHRFLRRHWIGAGATTLLILTLAGGVIARELEAKRTRLALSESRAISDFLVDLLEHASPLRVEDEDVMLQDIIDRGAQELDARFTGQPKVHARLLHTLGRVYGERGDYQRGAELMEKARKISLNSGHASGEEYIKLLSDLGVALRRQGHVDDAEQVLQEGFDKAEALKDTHPLLVADLANSLGNVYVIREDYAKAIRYHARALKLREANLPAGNTEITSSRNNLATALINSWQIDEAYPQAKKVLEEWEKSLPPGHPWIGIARNNLSIILERQGRKEEALALVKESLKDAEIRLGPDHPDVAGYWRNVGVAEFELGHYEAGQTAYRRWVEILTNALGPDAPRTLDAETRAASKGLDELDFAGVLAKLDSIKQRLLAGKSDTGLLIRLQLGRARALTELGRYAEAQSALDGQKQNIALLLGPDADAAIIADRRQAVLHAKEGKIEQAIEELKAIEQHAYSALSPKSVGYGVEERELAIQELAGKHYTEAIRWARASVDTFEHLHRAVAQAQSRQVLGRACLAAGRIECASEALHTVEKEYAKLYPAGHARNLEIQADLAKLVNAK